MKKYYVPLLIVIVLGCSLRVLSQDLSEEARKVTSVYNDKTDTTVVRFGPMHLKNFSTGGGPYSPIFEDGELRLSAFFTYKGKTLVKPQSIGWIFTSANSPGNRWELSKQKDLEITADDDHWNIPNVEIVGSTNGINLVIDLLGVAIPCDVFAKISNAKKVRLRLGDRRVDLAKEHLATLRDLAGHAGC